MNHVTPSPAITLADTLADPTGVMPSDAGADPQAELQRFHELLALVGRELAEPLTAALERVNALVGTGKIDRSGLRALLAEVDRARQAGIACQQIARLASGRARQSHERIHLAQVLQNVLAHRARELQNKGLALTPHVVPVDVLDDAPMLHALLNTLVDWCLACAHGTVHMQLSMSTWPVEGRLSVRLRHRPADHSDGRAPDAVPPAVNGLTWQLLSQTAMTMGLKLSQAIDALHAEVVIAFPRTVNPHRMDADVREEEMSFATSMNSRPLAGSHVLVVASRRDLRLLVREAVKPMGLVLDFVSSMAEAKAFCQQALPHAIVFESNLRGPAFDQLVIGIRKEVPEFVLLELLEAGDTLEISATSPTGVARVGREAILNGLPSALVYELSNVM